MPAIVNSAGYRSLVKLKWIVPNGLRSAFSSHEFFFFFFEGEDGVGKEGKGIKLVLIWPKKKVIDVIPDVYPA